MTTDAFTLAVTVIVRLSKTDPSTLSMDSSLSDLPTDSLDLFTVISEMEDAFGGTVTDEALGEMTTLGDLVRFFQDGAA